MKKATITTTLLLATSLLFAQQQPAKKLPPKVHISLTDLQISAIYLKIDSAEKIMLMTEYPSNFIQHFNARLNQVLSPIGLQLDTQLIAVKPDTTKKITKTPAKTN